MADADVSVDELRTAAKRLVGDDMITLQRAGRGANSSIFRLESRSRVLALKVYAQRAGDTRDRLDVEWRSLRFLAEQGVGRIPEAIARDDDRRIMVLEWLEGPLATEHTDAELDDAIDFMVQIFRASKVPQAVQFPPASEACLSAAEIVRQLDDRLSRFAPHARLARFLDTNFMPAFAVARRGVAAELAAPDDLAPHHRRLIPADFGFHNAIRTVDGLRFIDFEYFGWDDPVKLIADFVLHPAMSLSQTERARVRARMLAALDDDSDAVARLARHLPLYALRWALIVLNPFRADRPLDNPPDSVELNLRLEIQLAKAANLVLRANRS